VKDGSLSKLYQAHWSFLCAFIRARFGSGPPPPEDIAQDAFLKLADQVEKGQEIHNAKAFLTRVASNLVIDYHRSPKNRPASMADITQAEANDGCDVYSPENVFLNREALGILKDVLMSLSERDRAFVLMNRLEGLSYTEIAKRANMSRSGVQLIITQAVQKCMSKIKASHDTGQNKG